jgi:hypothetical protein
MNVSPATGSRRGSSGFIRPEFYAKAKAYTAGVCKQTTGYELSAIEDDTERLLVTGDYRLFYKHFYFSDSDNTLNFKTPETNKQDA